MNHPLIDIGANLAHDSFDDDRDAMMQRAADAGVTTMISHAIARPVLVALGMST